METIRKITDDLAIAEQVTPQQLQQLTQMGFKSVLNLRSPQELGFLSNDQQEAEFLELQYFNVPVNAKTMDYETARQVLQWISELPKPLLIYCDNGVRSAAMALLYITTQQGKPLAQALVQAQQLGLFSLISPA